MLINAQTLNAHLDNPDWVIFDCRHDLMDLGRGERLYREGHLPSAYFADLEADLSGDKTGRNGRHPLPSPAAFAAFLARHGVSATTTVVAYDDVGGQFASRLWWMCRWIGHQQAALLDGGIAAWMAQGLPLATAVPVARATALTATPDALMLISADELLPRLNSRDLALIDARAPERYSGDVEPIDPVAGHIPGALNRFYKNNLNADLTFKSPAILHAEFSALLAAQQHVTPVEVVHHCGSGVTACANIFAMTLAGIAHGQLYAGSWSEWVSDPTRPVIRKA
jgi:thiosulfate/3-mercaptopyruvate sulfurtransferase